jgi:hypothetical protein
MMFNMEFLTSLTNPPDSVKTEFSEMNPLIGRGRITVGSFSEQFEAPLYFWSREDYKKQWRAAVSRLASGATKTALLTAMHPADAECLITWWPLYRDQQTVYVQNHLLDLRTLTDLFSIANMDQFVRPHQTRDDEGNKISEWPIPFTEVLQYLEQD